MIFNFNDRNEEDTKLMIGNQEIKKVENKCIKLKGRLYKTVVRLNHS